MEHFNSDALGYNKSEVNEFVDYVIKKTEENIYTIKSQLDEIKRLTDELNRYKEIESSLLKSHDDRISLAEKEANLILSEAKDNANRIINDALIKAQKIEMEKQAFETNLKIIKKKVRNNLLEQLNRIEEIETL